MRTHGLVPALMIAAAAWLAPAARAEPLAIDEELLRDAASLLEEGSGRDASSSVLPLMDALKAQNKNSSGSGGSGGGLLSGVGVGLQFGSPTALTFKFGAGGNTNIVLGIGAGIGANDIYGLPGLSLHGDYLFTVGTLVNNGTLSLEAYIGPGIWILIDDGGRYGLFGGYRYAYGVGYFALAARMPLGLSLKFQTAPLELYIEAVPALFVFPGFDGGIGGAIGFRWFF